VLWFVIQKILVMIRNIYGYKGC